MYLWSRQCSCVLIRRFLCLPVINGLRIVWKPLRLILLFEVFLGGCHRSRKRILPVPNTIIKQTKPYNKNTAGRHFYGKMAATPGLFRRVGGLWHNLWNASYPRWDPNFVLHKSVIGDNGFDFVASSHNELPEKEPVFYICQKVRFILEEKTTNRALLGTL